MPRLSKTTLSLDPGVWHSPLRYPNSTPPANSSNAGLSRGCFPSFCSTSALGRHRTHPAPPPVFAPRRLVANHPRGYGGLRPRLEASSLPHRATEVAQNKEHPMNNLSSLVTVICLALMSLVIALLRAEHQEDRRALIVAFITREMGQ